MATPRDDNRRFLLRLWLPTIVVIGTLAALIIAALSSGSAERALPVLMGLLFGAGLLVWIRWHGLKTVERMLTVRDPEPMLRRLARSIRSMPYHPVFAACQSATVLALHDRVDEAEAALQSVSIDGTPPFIQAQLAAARGIVAYVRGSIDAGLDELAFAAQQADVDPEFPGAKQAEFAFRTYRNVGLALAGRATANAEEQLRAAFRELKIVGRILAAWGLAAIAKSRGDAAEVEAMRAFLRTHAPYFTSGVRDTAPAPSETTRRSDSSR